LKNTNNILFFLEKFKGKSSRYGTSSSVSYERENIQSIELCLFRSPKPSGKHRAAPPPPISRGLLIQIEPTNIGETSTEFEKSTG
jgi:hypothetical protein